MDRARLRKLSRPLLFAVGLALALHFLRSAGVAETLHEMRSAGRWIPLLVLLQGGILLCEAAGLRFLLVGTKREARDPMPSPSAWVRGTLLGFAWAVVLPAGRAAGEAIRASLFAEQIGLARAAGAAARQQACSLVGSTMACLAAAAVAFFVVGSRVLGVLLLANGVLVACLAAAVFLVVHHAGSGGRMHAWLSKIVADPHGSVAPDMRATVRAALCCSTGRLVQALQCGVALAAIGLHPTVASAFTAQGIQILGASAGDLVPGQVGVIEGMYSAFAKVLGVADAPARALSMALVLRAASWALAALGGIVGLAMRARGARSIETSL